MKRCRYFALAVLFTCVLLPAQNAAPPQLSDFAGTWKAQFKKQTWLVLTLVPGGSTLTGTFEHSIQISADDEGDITRVDDEMSNDKIISVELRGESLHIRSRDEEGDEDNYVLSLAGKDSAQLQSEVPEGSSAPKPFKLTRAPNPAAK